MTELREIKIYVACLTSYNNGILHGRWIDATLGADHMQDETKAMLAASPMVGAEEWAIHDYDAFEGIYISEHASFETVASYAAFIEEHGALGAKLSEHYGGDLEDAKIAITDHYAGCYDSAADFAQELTEQSIAIPQSICLYVNYEAMAQDMAINDVLTIETAHDQVHVFWRH